MQSKGLSVTGLQIRGRVARAPGKAGIVVKAILPNVNTRARLS